MKGLIDIKGVEDLNYTNPLWYLLAIVTLILIIAIVIYFKKRKRVYKFKLTPKEIAKENILNIDFNNPKSVAYIFSEDVYKFIDNSTKEKFKELENALLEYKYKKEVPKLDAKLEQEIKKFIKGIKWEI